MKTVLQHTALLWALVLAGGAPFVAGAAFAAEPAYQATLDIDHDGKPDRAVVTLEPDGPSADLAIYLSDENKKFDSARKPDFVKTDLTSERVQGLESKGNGSLIVKYGCGGCSNDYETSLTIVYRGGAFLVAGFALDWDTQKGIGSCDIDFLTGKGVASHGLHAASKPLRGKFKPVALADWSDDRRPKGCVP